MNQTLAALLLGVVEGVTEFLPVSSTGHLLLAEHWLGKRSELFNVTIQLGAILAVVMVYRVHLGELIAGIRIPERRDELCKIGVSFLITAVLGLMLKLSGFKLEDRDVPAVATALFLGAIVILLVEWWGARQPLARKLTWRVVVAVGISQVVAAAFPGTSRSGAAMIAAIVAGLTDRRKAAEFAFLVGIPTMFAAAGLEFFNCLGQNAPHENWGELALAAAASGVVGFFAVHWLIRYVSGHSLTPFAVYRLVLAAALWLWL